MTGKQTRSQVTVTRKVHPVYAQSLERLEAIGFDLERVITIATNAVWAVGRTVMPEDTSKVDPWIRGNYAQAVGLVASGEYCREPWEKTYPMFPAAEFYPEATERIKAAIQEYMDRMRSTTTGGHSAR